MLEQLRTYADLAGFDRRLRWVAVLALAVVVSGLEAIGALLIYALLAMVTGVEGAFVLPVIGDVRTAAPGLTERRLMLWAAAAIAGFFLVRGLIVLAKEYVVARVTDNAGARLSGRLAAGYLAMPYEFHLQRNSAELIRNAYSTVQETVRNVFRPLVIAVSEALVVVGILAVLVATAPAATALVVAVLGTAGVVLLRLVYPKLKRLGRGKQDASRSSIQSLQQSLGGIRDIKVLGRERYFEREFTDARHEMARAHYLRQVLEQVPIVGLETIMVIFIAGLFGALVVVEGSAIGAVPVLGLFGYAALRLKPSISEIARSLNSMRFTSAGIDDLRGDLVLFAGTQPRERLDEQAEVEPLPFRRAITLEHVSYRYPGSDDDALRDVSVRIARGTSVGIVGPTGGGKTTLLDVILGLLEPTRGTVRVDDRDLREHPRAWQAQIGLVPQTLFIVDDTLRHNIALGRHEDEIDDEAVAESVRLAQLDDVVARLPQGLGTVVGERGVRLSGGQRQRVAIARALYRRPAVLVFDEGTSALDNETERHLLEALRALRRDRTIITVAHRLTTVRDCDDVLFVDEGRVVDTGPFDELLRRNARFAAMAATLETAP